MDNTRESTNWIDRVFRCEPTDEEAAVELVFYLCGLAEIAPPQDIIFLESPLEVETAYASAWSRPTTYVYPPPSGIYRSLRAAFEKTVTLNSPIVTNLIYDLLQSTLPWRTIGLPITRLLNDSIPNSIKSVEESPWAVRRVHGTSICTTLFPEVLVVSDYWPDFPHNRIAQSPIKPKNSYEKLVDLICRAKMWGVIPDRDVWYISRHPEHIRRIRRNNAWVMHSEDEMALKWRDGWGGHYLHGVYVPEELWVQIMSREMKFKEVLKILNIEHRMLALKYMEPQRLLKSSKARLLNKSKRGNKLYMIDDPEIFSKQAYFLLYKDPSTEREYLSGVHPDVGQTNDADKCMAWKHHFTDEEYKELTTEA